MKLRKLLILSAGVLLLSGCVKKDGALSSTSVNQKSPATSQDLVLYNTLVDKNNNWMFSPYSIKDAFSILYHGADDDTKEEFKNVLGLDEEVVSAIRDYDKYITEQEKESIRIANRAYVTNNQAIKKQLNVDILGLGKKEIEDMDVSHPQKAADKINQFVKDTTNGKISNLVSAKQINEDSSMIIVNALYFNKEWDFEKGNVKWEDGNNYKAFCDYDYSVKNIKEVDNRNIDILRLDYGTESRYAMTIFTKSVNAKENKVDEYLEHLDPEELQEILDFKDYGGLKNYDSAEFYVPNFEFSNKYQIKEALKELGMSAAFSGGFKKLGPVDISDVVHATYIKTNEKGTEAAAATAISMETMSAKVEPKKIKTVRADNTFVFVITDTEIDTILFMGRVVTPSEPQN